MAIRESDCQNWNDPSNQQYNLLKGLHSSGLDPIYQDLHQKSVTCTDLDDVVYQGIYNQQDVSCSYSSVQLESDSSVQLEADDLNLALPVVIDNNGEICIQKDESSLVYTSLEPSKLSQHCNNIYQSSRKQIYNQPSNSMPHHRQQQHNANSEDYMLFDHQEQILTAVESDRFERSYLPHDLPGIESTFGGSRNRTQFMNKNKRISESSDSSGQGGASSENDSAKYDDNPLSSPSADEEQNGASAEKKQQQSGQHKWVSRPLIKDCRICESPATSVQHYGSISCYSCRAFFRRTVGSQREYLKCSRGDDSCTVDAVNRTNCKKCRYKKCIKVGMRPEKVDRVVRKREAMKSDSKEKEDSTALSTKCGSAKSTALSTHCGSTDADSNNVDAKMQILAEEKNAIAKETKTESHQNILLEETDAEMRILTENKFEKHLSYVDYSKPMDYIMNEDMNMISDNKPEEVSPKLAEPATLDNQGPKLAELESLDIERLMDEVYDEAHCNNQPGACTEPNTGNDSDLKTKTKVQDLYTNDTSRNYNNRFSIPFGDIESIDLTIEEEFRIYSLMAKRQQLFSTFFTVLKRMPRFMESLTNFFSSISQGYGCITTVLPDTIPISFLPGLQKLNLSQINKFSRLINMDCAHNIDVQTRLEMMTLSMPALEILTRGIIHGNADKGTFINQHAAAGTLNPVFEEVIKEVKGFEDVKSFSPLNLDIFTSPWAVCMEDEDKFTNTLNEIGDLIKDDKKLGCLYFFLVLLSPVSINAGQVHPEFAKMQNVLSLLTYRYIKSKTKDITKANSIMDRLRRLIKDLHECADIHRNRRIFRPFEFPKFDEMLEALDKTIINI